MVNKRIIYGIVLLIAVLSVGWTLPGHTRFGGLVSFNYQSVTIADDGAGTSPGATWTSLGTSDYRYTCADSDGCTLTFSETSIIDGMRLFIFNAGSNTITVSDSSGVVEMASTYAMAQYAWLSLVYVSDRWIEQGRGSSTALDIACSDCVALSTETTGNYAAGDGEAGAALTGDSATAFFSAGTIESARLPSPPGIRFTIEAPGATENIIAGITDKAITVTSVSSVCLGTTPSVDWNFAHGTDLTAAADLFTADKQTTSVTTIETDSATFNDATIAAGEAILFQTSAASGTIANCNFTIFFTVD